MRTPDIRPTVGEIEAPYNVESLLMLPRLVFNELYPDFLATCPQGTADKIVFMNNLTSRAERASGPATEMTPSAPLQAPWHPLYGMRYAVGLRE